MSAQQLNTQQLLGLYQHMLASRESDVIEAELVNSGEANFLASSQGHEGSAILAPFLNPSDWLQCHYRDKALMLARGVTSEMFFYSALAKAESHSHGRQMVSHMSAPELNLTSIVGPVGNNALQSAGVAHVIKDGTDNPIVVCCIGDGTSQQGEVLEAIAEAKRSALPMLFFIHNNNLAISTKTKGATFFSLPDGRVPDSFYDTKITYIDGARPLEYTTVVGEVIGQIRASKQPQIIIFNVERLESHSNADDQKLYRSNDEISHSKQNDPVISSFEYLKKLGLSEEVLISAGKVTIDNVRHSLEAARLGNIPKPTFTATAELPEAISNQGVEYRGDFAANDRLTMLEAMREVFRHQLKNDPNVCLLGEDIEDDKGDVFGTTRGLSTAYPGRVTNTALSESTIVGMACGMSLAGKKPVAFIQFADFMPLAYNQIFSEVATMYWRTNGGWQCPVIIFAACGGYRPGLGPFHSQTNEALFVHTPGLDVYMPSNAADAAGMLNAAFKSGRPSVFLYPKKLLNNGSNQDTTSKDVYKQIVPVGKARLVRSGSDVTLVGYGNTVSLCTQVAETLETIGVNAEVIDLRTLKPYDLSTILHSALKTKHLIVTHEDSGVCGVASEIIASVIEATTTPIKVARVTRADTYTPCNYVNQLQVLPSFEGILTQAAKLLGLELSWQEEDGVGDDSFMVEVIGASPSDESVLINKIHIQPGDSVKSGDILVDIEASKAAGEIVSPYDGTIDKVFVTVDERAMVGSKLLSLRLKNKLIKVSQIKKRKPILSRKITEVKVHDNENIGSSVYPVSISLPHFKTGGKKVSNNELLKNFNGYSNEDIIKRTGIESRYWLKDDEKIIDVASEVIRGTLTKNNLKLDDINLIVCATCSPEKYQSPSMACLILNKLYETYGEHTVPAYDINAACSGYIYALQSAHDYLQTRPDERVLLITAEALSTRINKNDFETAFLFGDAASATILFGANHLKDGVAIINDTHLSAVAEDGSVLSVPASETDSIKLEGKKLFTFAVKTMSTVMHKSCQKSALELQNVDLIIPHQANQRIISAIERRLNLHDGALYSNIARYGNTSSCTIPIAMSETVEKLEVGQTIALCAFGGGFTAAAAVLTKI